MPSWGSDLVNKLISISISIHESTHFILFALLKVHPRLACGPPTLMDPGAPPRLTPLSVGLPVWYLEFILYKNVRYLYDNKLTII